MTATQTPQKTTNAMHLEPQAAQVDRKKDTDASPLGQDRAARLEARSVDRLGAPCEGDMAEPASDGVAHLQHEAPALSQPGADPGHDAHVADVGKAAAVVDVPIHEEPAQVQLQARPAASGSESESWHSIQADPTAQEALPQAACEPARPQQPVQTSHLGTAQALEAIYTQAALRASNAERGKATVGSRALPASLRPHYLWSSDNTGLSTYHGSFFMP